MKIGSLGKSKIDTLMGKTGISLPRGEILTDEQEEMVMILMIGMPEAYAIKSQITDEPPPERPLTHDLLKSVFDNLEATIEQVVITEMYKERFYVAEIHVEANGRAMTIDSRPTDGIALALNQAKRVYQKA